MSHWTHPECFGQKLGDTAGCQHKSDVFTPNKQRSPRRGSEVLCRCNVDGLNPDGPDYSSCSCLFSFSAEHCFQTIGGQKVNVRRDGRRRSKTISTSDFIILIFLWGRLSQICRGWNIFWQIPGHKIDNSGYLIKDES